MASKASFADQQSQVQENVHAQVNIFAMSMDEILIPDNKRIGDAHELPPQPAAALVGMANLLTVLVSAEDEGSTDAAPEEPHRSRTRRRGRDAADRESVPRRAASGHVAAPTRADAARTGPTRARFVSLDGGEIDEMAVADRIHARIARAIQGGECRKEDCFFGEFHKQNPPTFDGEPNTMAVENWLLKMEKLLRALECTDA
nr:hypothetical protein CFP56_68294 [Quercus suber]